MALMKANEYFARRKAGWDPCAERTAQETAAAQGRAAAEAAAFDELEKYPILLGVRRRAGSARKLAHQSADDIEAYLQKRR